MPIHPQVQTLLKQLQQLPPVTQLTPKQARIMAEMGYTKDPNRQIRVASVQNLLLPDYHAAIPLRIYTPLGNPPWPILLYFHGGGWVLGNLEAVDGICRSLCTKANCIVISVDYRLAPEYKFPSALEDVYQTAIWVSENAQKLQGNPDQIAVAGDSAGGNLAAVLAIMARNRQTLNFCHQLLIYPVTNYDFNTPSYQKYAEGFGLKREEMIWFWEHYLADKTQGDHFYASPLQAEDLSNLPSAQIITAEYDVLRSEGEAYATKLQQFGVKVNSKCYQGFIHGFLGLPPLNSLTNSVFAEIGSELQLVFSSI